MGADDVPSYSSRAFGAAKVFIKLAKLLDLNFPERTKRVLIVRAPMLFPVVWRMVSPFVPAATKQKIAIFGSSGWTEAALGAMAEAALPPWLDERRAGTAAGAAAVPLFIGGCVPTPFVHAPSAAEQPTTTT